MNKNNLKIGNRVKYIQEERWAISSGLKLNKIYIVVGKHPNNTHIQVTGQDVRGPVKGDSTSWWIESNAFDVSLASNPIKRNTNVNRLG